MQPVLRNVSYKTFFNIFQFMNSKGMRTLICTNDSITVSPPSTSAFKRSQKQYYHINIQFQSLAEEMVLKMADQVNSSFAFNSKKWSDITHATQKKRRGEKRAKSHNQQLISFTSVWTQWAGGWPVCFTASSNNPSRSSSPGLEHIENPPTTDTPGIKKSTLKIDQKQKFFKKSTTSNMENNHLNKMAAFVSIILPSQRSSFP